MFLLILENPSESTRLAAKHLEITRYEIQKTLKKYKYKPYKIRPVQKLTDRHKQQRMALCQELLTRQNEDRNFINKIIWTDEATFSTAGCFNRKNMHMWSQQNRHEIREIKFQGRRSIHVWCGILGNRVLGPIFFNGNLTGPRFYNFLNNEISDILDNLPRQEGLIWQMDGAPPHNVQPVTEFLNQRFPTWIGKNGPIRWASNSPDITVPDTFLWGHLKDKVYAEPNHTIETIQQKIISEINILNNENQHMIQRAVTNLIRRFRLCIEKDGGHFQQFM